MKKFNIINMAKNIPFDENDYMDQKQIINFCNFFNKLTNCGFPTNTPINKDFVYKYKEAMKSMDKFKSGKNIYIFSQKEIYWELVDLYIEFQYTKHNEENLEDNIKICNNIFIEKEYFSDDLI